MKIQVSNLCKNYLQGQTCLTVLKDISFTLENGSTTALVGQSGCGKSTLLHLMGLLDSPSSGEVFFDDKKSSSMNESKRTKFRSNHLGYVYQFHHLLQNFTAIENVMMPLLIKKESFKSSRDKAREILDKVGLLKRIDHLPSQLSGGEQQRVAIARALIHEPDFLLADEPTGNLDPETAKIVFELLIKCISEQKATALIATHDHSIAEKVGKIIKL